MVVFRKASSESNYRIIQAKRLRLRLRLRLISTGISLTSVEILCGFSDQSHLTRIFKSKVGVTPGQFSRGCK
ncbi:MAG: hypothetical protein CTY37_00020 [Methylotenera sp.]|nr:MAG: hypothetical protein CTY37_00020 [Methylotenera sp.]